MLYRGLLVGLKFLERYIAVNAVVALFAVLGETIEAVRQCGLILLNRCRGDLLRRYAAGIQQTAGYFFF